MNCRKVVSINAIDSGKKKLISNLLFDLPRFFNLMLRSTSEVSLLLL